MGGIVDGAGKGEKQGFRRRWQGSGASVQVVGGRCQVGGVRWDVTHVARRQNPVDDYGDDYG
jgi:hypothetical protein